MKKITISIALTCMLILGITQLFAETEIEFNEMTHDFGTIREADGPVNFQFNFRNSGKGDLEIYSVKAT